jgi:hypothetical protein
LDLVKNSSLEQVGFCEYPFDFSCLENEQRRKEEAMAGIGPVSQDWEPVVVRKKAPNASAKKDEKAVNEARRAGGPIETIKKCKMSQSFSVILFCSISVKKFSFTSFFPAYGACVRIFNLLFLKFFPAMVFEMPTKI